MTLEQWSVLLGALMPGVVAVVNQPRWQPWQRALATVLICLAGGAALAAAQGRFTGRGLADSVGLTLTAALVFYHTIWRPSGVTDAIEKATALPAKPTGPPV